MYVQGFEDLSIVRVAAVVRERVDTITIMFTTVENFLLKSSKSKRPSRQCPRKVLC